MSYEYKQEVLQRLEDGTLESLKPEQEFNFLCRDECMGRCCTSITILLDPWDVETMARHLGIAGREFITEYCKYDFSPELKWPYVWLGHAEDGPCIFMLEDGKCEVYPSRSRNCRTYPVGRAVRFESDGTKKEVVFMVDKMNFCHGHKAEEKWTVKEWLEDAESQKFYQLSDLYLELINYAQTDLKSQMWMNANIAQMMMPLLYGPDLLRQKLNISEEMVDHEEFYRRRIKALRVILTDIASGFGCGPKADVVVDGSGVSMMDRMKQVLITGEE